VPEDLIIDMLNGEVDIFADFLFPGDDLDERILEVVRMGVGIQEANPFDALDPYHIPQECFERNPLFQIPAIRTRILGDQNYFSNASSGQLTYLFDHGTRVPAAKSPPQFWDRTEGAGPRASLCDFDISGMVRGRDQTGSSVIVEETGVGVHIKPPGGVFYQSIDEVELVHPDKEIYFRKLFQELAAIPLWQAAADD